MERNSPDGAPKNLHEEEESKSEQRDESSTAQNEESPAEVLAPMMQIQLKMINKESLSLSIPQNLTVRELKETIERETAQEYEATRQRLIFTGKVLRDDMPLSEYNIVDGSAIHMVYRRDAAVSTTATPVSSTQVSTSVSSTTSAPTPTTSIPMHHLGNGIMMGRVNLDGENLSESLNSVLGSVLQGLGVSNSSTIDGDQPVEVEFITANTSAPSTTSQIRSSSVPGTTAHNTNHQSGTQPVAQSSSPPTPSVTTIPTNVNRRTSETFDGSSSSDARRLRYYHRQGSRIERSVQALEAPHIASLERTNSTELALADSADQVNRSLLSVTPHLSHLSRLLRSTTQFSDQERVSVQRYMQEVATALMQVGGLCSDLGNTFLQTDLGDQNDGATVPSNLPHTVSQTVSQTGISTQLSPLARANIRRFLPRNPEPETPVEHESFASPTRSSTTANSSSANSATSATPNVANPTTSANASAAGNANSSESTTTQRNTFESTTTNTPQGIRIERFNGDLGSLIGGITGSLANGILQSFVNPQSVPAQNTNNTSQPVQSTRSSGEDEGNSRTSSTTSVPAAPTFEFMIKPSLKRILHKLFEVLASDADMVSAAKTFRAFFQELFQEQMLENEPCTQQDLMNKWIESLVQEMNSHLVSSSMRECLYGDRATFDLEPLQDRIRSLFETLCETEWDSYRTLPEILIGLNSLAKAWLDDVKAHILGGTSTHRTFIRAAIHTAFSFADEVDESRRTRLEECIFPFIEKELA